MIEFTAVQEDKMHGRDCRAWTELVAREWYASGLAGACDYPATKLVQQLRAVYFTCQLNDMRNIEHISALGFIVLRAGVCRIDPNNLKAITEFFLKHAHADNADYAQTWIDMFLEGE